MYMLTRFSERSFNPMRTTGITNIYIQCKNPSAEKKLAPNVGSLDNN